MYMDISTFGGHCDDFMLVVNSRVSQQTIAPPMQTEKIVLSMPKFKVMFSALNYLARGQLFIFDLISDT